MLKKSKTQKFTFIIVQFVSCGFTMIILIYLSSTNLFAQTQTNSELEVKVEEIDALCSQYKTLDSLRVRYVPIDEPIATLKVFTFRENVICVETELHNESNRTQFNLYYHQGLLIKLASCAEEYDNAWVLEERLPTIEERTKVARIVNNAYYFENGQMIYWNSDDSLSTEAGSEEFIFEGETILNLGNYFYQIATSSN